MAMKVKVGDVVRLNEAQWSYQGKHTAGHVGVVTAIHEMLDPMGGHQWVNLDDEEGAPFWNPVTNMTMLADRGMLLEEIISSSSSSNGDILVATRENDEEDNRLEVGGLYTLMLEGCGCFGHAECMDGEEFFSWGGDYWFVNLSAMKREYDRSESSAEVVPFPVFLDEAVATAPKYPEFEDMDDVAKGAILLAAHEGKTVQFLSKMGGGWVDDMSFDPSENFAYRVKPQELIDAEEALNAAASNVVSLREAADAAHAALEAGELSYKEAREVIETLQAA